METHWATLPLTAVVDSVCSIFSPTRNQSDPLKPAYYLKKRKKKKSRLLCAWNVRTGSHIQRQTRRCATSRPRLDVFLMANKVQRQRGTAWQRRLLLFDASQCGCAIEVSFEDKGRTIIKVCCWSDRGIAANDVYTDWKQIGFIVSVTYDDLTCQRHMWSLIWGYAYMLSYPQKNKVCFCSISLLRCGQDIARWWRFSLFRFIMASGVGLLWTWSHKGVIYWASAHLAPKYHM